MISVFKRINMFFVVVFLFFMLSSTSAVAQFAVENPVPTKPMSIEFDGPIVPGPIAPPTGSTFEGPDFDTNGTNVGSFFIPPDPSGAAGPSHVVCVVNCTIQWHTKNGTRQKNEGLRGFFTSLTPTTNTFDPKVIYDQHASRFVVVTLESTRDPDISRILLAVSDDSDPNGTWHFTAIDSKTTIGGIDHWADYPGFAVDEDVVYVTNNMFSFQTNSFGGVRLWIIKKGVGTNGFYDGGTAGVTVHDPGTFSTTQIAHILGTPPSGAVGTWLCSYGGLSNGTDEFLTIIRVDSPLGSPTFNLVTLNVGDIDNTFTSMPNAPQSGSAVGISTNDRRALNAVWRDNSLWITAQVVPGSGPDSGQATAHWWEVNTTTLGSPSLTQQGNVGGEDIATGTFTFFPSITVNSDGNMGIGFAASAPTIFPGAYYTGRLTTDSSGTVQSTETLAAGIASYVRTFGGFQNRWGDYSGISVDPADDRTFWVFNEYAIAQGTGDGENGRWGTRWGSFSFPRITVSKTVDSGSSSTSPGTADVRFLQLGVVTDSGIATITSVKAKFTGTSSAVNSDISAFDVFDDTDGDGNIDAGSSPIGTVSSPDLTNGATVTGLSFSVTTTTKHLLLVLDIAVGADSSHTVGLELTSSTFITSSDGLMTSTNFAIANSNDQSLPVELSSFTGKNTRDGIFISWRTQSEVRNLGFYLYRSETKNGEYIRITPTRIKGHGTDSTPHDYNFLDESAEDGQSYWYLIEDVDFAGVTARSSPIQVVFDRQAALQKIIPTRFALHQNYPNPFNPETWIPYDLAADTNVSVTIYNGVGQKIRTLSLGAQPAGIYLTKEKAAYWDGRSDIGESVSSGVYFYYLHAGDFYAMKKMIILK